MTAAPSSERSQAGGLLVAGIVLAALTEAIASTVLSLGRGDSSRRFVSGNSERRGPWGISRLCRIAPAWPRYHGE